MQVPIEAQDRARNVALHDYQRLSIEIARQIILRHLDDFLSFARVLLSSK